MAELLSTLSMSMSGNQSVVASSIVRSLRPSEGSFCRFQISQNYPSLHLQVEIGQSMVKPVPLEVKLDCELLCELVDLHDVNYWDCHVHLMMITMVLDADQEDQCQCCPHDRCQCPHIPSQGLQYRMGLESEVGCNLHPWAAFLSRKPLGTFFDLWTITQSFSSLPSEQSFFLSHRLSIPMQRPGVQTWISIGGWLALD